MGIVVTMAGLLSPSISVWLVMAVQIWLWCALVTAAAWHAMVGKHALPIQLLATPSCLCFPNTLLLLQTVLYIFLVLSLFWT